MIDTRLSAARQCSVGGKRGHQHIEAACVQALQGKGGSFRLLARKTRYIVDGDKRRAEAKADAGPPSRKGIDAPTHRIAREVAHVREIRLAAFCIFGHCVHDLLKQGGFGQSHPVRSRLRCPFGELGKHVANKFAAKHRALAAGSRVVLRRVPTLARRYRRGQVALPGIRICGARQLRELFFRRATCWQNGSGEHPAPQAPRSQTADRRIVPGTRIPAIRKRQQAVVQHRKVIAVPYRHELLRRSHFLCAAEGTPESSSSCRTIAGTNSGCVTGSFEVVVAEPESSP